MIERQLQVLGRLAELGLEIAGAIERKIKAAEAAHSHADLNAETVAYARVVREVRLSLVQQEQMIRDHQNPDAAERQAQESGAQGGRRSSLSGSPFTTLPTAAALADEVRAFKAVRPLQPGAGRRSGR